VLEEIRLQEAITVQVRQVLGVLLTGLLAVIKALFKEIVLVRVKAVIILQVMVGAVMETLHLSALQRALQVLYLLLQ
jgi:hypothetical protein